MNREALSVYPESPTVTASPLSYGGELQKHFKFDLWFPVFILALESTSKTVASTNCSTKFICLFKGYLSLMIFF